MQEHETNLRTIIFVCVIIHKFENDKACMQHYYIDKLS